MTAPESWAAEDATGAKMAALKRTKKSLCVQLQNGDVVNVASKLASLAVALKDKWTQLADACR